MNAVQFGRWFSERRRTGGWPSQRLLAEAAQQHTLLEQAGISEDFLSRLEAGHLAHPFRGSVRKRMLLLAWLFCKTPRDLKVYLKAAGLTDTSAEEQAQIHMLNGHLASLQTPPPLLLPARPGRLKGREKELESILHALSEPDTRVLALTGMPGVGKSALAHEALYRLAAVESERLRRFSDGIATFTCTGRQGTRGLISLLSEITELFTSTTGSPRKRTPGSATEPTSEPESEQELAFVVDYARAALANKRLLLLLDDLDPAFPLRQALDVLLAQGEQTLYDTRIEASHEQRVILATSQFVPAPALISARLQVQPLDKEAALDLLMELVGEEWDCRERFSARQALAAIGYLPLAIEGMATAIQANSIPLALVAAHLSQHPLGELLGSKEEVAEGIERALAHLEHHLRTDYLLLAALELSTFDLESAAAILSCQRLPLPDLNQSVAHLLKASYAAQVSAPVEACLKSGSQPGGLLPSPQGSAPLVLKPAATQESEQMARLAGAAAILGQFVRLSLLEISSQETAQDHPHGSEAGMHAQGLTGSSLHYRMHPLLYVYAREMVHTLPEKCLELARHNLLSHALTRALSEKTTLPAHQKEAVLADLLQAHKVNQPQVVTRLAREFLPLS